MSGRNRSISLGVVVVCNLLRDPLSLGVSLMGSFHPNLDGFFVTMGSKGKVSSESTGVDGTRSLLHLILSPDKLKLSMAIIVLFSQSFVVHFV